MFGRSGVGVFHVLARRRRYSASGEYRTYFHIACDWQVSETTICHTVHWMQNVLVNCGRFRLGGKKSLLTPSEKLKIWWSTRQWRV
ncbi:transposase family protein [Nostoc sp.]|uniref:transposase family protein n=1 Tax=Nostoc sp. TaxID=1180 RepID=UPI003FA5AD1A